MTQGWFFTIIGLGVFLSMFSAVAALRLRDSDLWHAWSQAAGVSVLVITVFSVVRARIPRPMLFGTLFYLGGLLLFLAVLPSAFATRAAALVTRRDAAPEWGELVTRAFVAYCVVCAAVFVVAIMVIWLLLGGFMAFSH